MRRSALALLLLLCCACAGCQTSRPQHEPFVMHLTGPYRFTLDPEKGEWQPIEIGVEWDRFGFAQHDGAGWYECEFALERVPRGKIAVAVSAVDDNADVWLNGTALGSHAGYNVPFAFDVTGVLRRGMNRLVIRVVDIGGPGGLIGSVRLVEYSDLESLQRAPLAQQSARPSADWVRDAVIYEVFLRNFSHEGTIAALETRLPGLKDLGVTVLWLMPVHPVGELKRHGTHGSPYAVQDFRAVHPEFGTRQDLKRLVSVAQALGMKVILDLVANHTAWDNPLVAAHPEWYRRDAHGNITWPADWIDTAHLNYENAALREYMIETMIDWVRHVGIDGYRCDVAGMVPLDFWEDARAELDRIKPVMMLAEDSQPAQHLRAFDLTYAWDLEHALRTIVRDGAPATRIEELITREQRTFPRGSLRLRFISNHDMNSWHAPAIETFGAPGAKAAAVVAFTLPGVPLIYNGDEIGNAKPLALFEKVPIDWTVDPHDMRAFHRELLAVRRQVRAFFGNEIEFVRTENEDAVVAYYRGSGTDRVVVAVNLKSAPARINLPHGPKLFGNATSEGDAITLPAFGYFIAPAAQAGN
jgi:glycosidase